MTSLRGVDGLVSVIVPAYNLQDFIGRCTGSILAQSYPKIELIVVDDGSSDCTLESIKKASGKDERVTIVPQSNGGAASARNNGIRHAKGEFLMFVDGDDWISPDTVERNISFFDDGNVDWVEFPVIRVGEDGADIRSEKLGSNFRPDCVREVEREEFIRLFVDGTLSGLVCGSILRRSCVSDIIFPENHFYEDSFYFLDILANSSKGILSPYGRYNYLERAGSSQHCVVEGKRLLSKAAYDIATIDLVTRKFPEDIALIEASYPDIYYFYRLQKAKKLKDSDCCLRQIKDAVGARRLTLRRRIKIAAYETFGYRNIRRIFSLLKSLA